MNSVEVEYRDFLARRHFGSLDGIRCIAILVVLWHHSAISSNISLGGISERGFLGVDLFFVLSGFLIVTLLLREKSRRGEIALGKFYMRRTLRIFPPYYALLALLVVVYLAIPNLNTAAGFFNCLPYYVTYTSNWSLLQAANLAIIWSLATEEQFYLVWPAVEKFLRPWAIAVVLGAVIGVNQLINFGLLDGLFARIYETQGRPNLPILECTFTPIALGVVAAHVLNNSRGYVLARQWLGGRYSPLALSVLIVILLICLPGDLSGWPRLAIHIAIALWLASLVVREDHIMRPILAAAPITFIGAVSYGMYLYHMWVFHAVGVGCRSLEIRSELAVFALNVAATIVVATASYRLLERPFLAMKDRFASASPRA